MPRYLSIQDILNAVYADGRINVVQSSQDIINIVFDKDKKALRVNMDGGGIPAVDDESELPEDAKEGDVGAVVKDGAITFYVFTDGEWTSLAMKGGVSIDHDTIEENSNSEIEVVGIKETNQNLTQKIWIGTLEEYVSQGKANDGDICIITNDEVPFVLMENVETVTTGDLTVVPGKAYHWTPVSSGVIGFNHKEYSGIRLEIHVTLELSSGVTITGATGSDTSVTINGTPSSGEWTLLWNGTEAVFARIF